MVKYFLSFLILLAHLSSFSQRYSVIYPEKEFIYTNANWGVSEGLSQNCGVGSYIGLKIDSFKVIGTDSIFYHYNILRQTNENPPNCSFYQKYPNWPGSKTVVKNTGESIFLSHYGDSIRIRVKAAVNDKWHLYDSTNGDYFEAEVISKIYGNILSVSDSIKVIEISLMDNSGNPKAHDFNGKQILLSKHYGLLKAYDFSRFPKDTSAFILQGISNPEMGVQNLSDSLVYDFEVGDEFHIEDNSTYIPYNGTFIKERRIILSKSFSTNLDTLKYTTERIVFKDYRDFSNQTSDTSVIRDTIIEKYIFSQVDNINIIPSKMIEIEIEGSAYYNCSTISGYNGRIIKFPMDAHTGDNDECFDAILTYEPISHYYIEGLGHYYEGDYFPNQNHRKLVYYKKGAETWGSAIDFDLLLAVTNKTKLQVNLNISPNPFTDFTIFKIHNPQSKLYHLQILDLSGKIIRDYDFNGDEQIIKNDGSLNGFYIYKLYNESNEVKEGKLIVY